MQDRQEQKTFTMAQVLTLIGKCHFVWGDRDSGVSIHSLTQDVSYLLECDYNDARIMLYQADRAGSNWQDLIRCVYDQVSFFNDTIRTQMEAIAAISDKPTRIEQLVVFYNQLKQNHGDSFTIYPLSEYQNQNCGLK